MTHPIAPVEDPATTFRIDLPLVLPGVGDAQDACVARLVSLLEGKNGVSHVHILRAGERFPGDDIDASRRVESPDTERPQMEAQLCLHYDPERVTLTNVTSLVQAAGAEVRDAFGHATISFRAVGSEDDGRRIEDELRALPGVSAASVSFAAQVARVEFARSQIDEGEIENHMRRLGLELAAAPSQVRAADGQIPADTNRRDVAAGWTLLSHRRRLVHIRTRLQP